MNKLTPLFWKVKLLLAFSLVWLIQGWASGALPVKAAEAKPSAAAEAQKSPVSAPGAIVFSRNEAIFYLGPGEKQPRQLAQGRWPALSPDGRKVAYGPGQDGRGLLLLELATGQSTPLAPPLRERLDAPSWSPRGDLLAFLYNYQEVYLTKADGSGRQKIFTVPGGAYYPPAWAADGQSLFVNDLDNLYQIDLKGKELARRPLTSFTGKKSAVTSTDRFLPHPQDTQLWAFTMAVEGTPKFTKTFNEPNQALFLYDERTQKRTRLTPPDMLATQPCWSRDGRFLYFSGYREPHYQERYPFRIYLMGRDGSGLAELGKGEGPSQ